ncbi:MAG: hypothetical protein HFI09_00390 [Bacilli bacterium]|nr:hypothetical protein [Bacilli bacterium]
MFLTFFGDGLHSIFSDLVATVKELLGDTWNVIYSFLAQYFSEAMIYLFVGAILLAVSLILILKAINK